MLYSVQCTVCSVVWFFHSVRPIQHTQQPKRVYSLSVWYILSMICNMFKSARECCAEVDKTCNKSWIVQRIESSLYCLLRKFIHFKSKKHGIHIIFLIAFWSVDDFVIVFYVIIIRSNAWLCVYVCVCVEGFFFFILASNSVAIDLGWMHSACDMQH